jgi:transcriptional regulator with XRE-family HTH domain
LARKIKVREVIGLNIGDRIRRLREEKGMLQEDLADTLGISRQLVSSYENGHRIPPIKKLNKLAELFGVSTDYLIGRTNVPSDAVKELQHLEIYLRGVVPSEEDAEMIMDYIKKRRAAKEAEERLKKGPKS